MTAKKSTATETVETTKKSINTEISITSNAKIVMIDDEFFEVVDGKVVQIEK